MRRWAVTWGSDGMENGRGGDDGKEVPWGGEDDSNVGQEMGRSKVCEEGKKWQCLRQWNTTWIFCKTAAAISILHHFIKNDTSHLAAWITVLWVINVSKLSGGYIIVFISPPAFRSTWCLLRQLALLVSRIPDLEKETPRIWIWFQRKAVSV